MELWSASRDRPNGPKAAHFILAFCGPTLSLSRTALRPFPPPTPPPPLNNEITNPIKQKENAVCFLSVCRLVSCVFPVPLLFFTAPTVFPSTGMVRPMPNYRRVEVLSCSPRFVHAESEHFRLFVLPLNFRFSDALEALLLRLVLFRSASFLFLFFFSFFRFSRVSCFIISKKQYN